MAGPGVRDPEQWAVAVQLADMVLEWADGGLPNFFYFPQVAVPMFERVTNLAVWKLMAVWMVPVAKLVIAEFDDRRARINSDARMPGEDLARLTIALWDAEVDDEMRLQLFKAMEMPIVFAVADAAKFTDLLGDPAGHQGVIRE